MKRLYARTGLLLAIMLACSLFSFAQFQNPRFVLSVAAGSMVYQGDLTPWRSGSLKTQKLLVQLAGSKIINRFVSMGGTLVLSRLKGDEARYINPEYRPQRAFAFTSPLIELSARVTINPLGSNTNDRKLVPYFFTGFGLAKLKVKRDFSRINAPYFPETAEVWTGLAIDTSQSTPTLLPVIPLGAGVSYYFAGPWGVVAEANYRLTSSDYIDGFSQSVNPEKKDHFWNYALGIIYRTNGKDRLDCPKMKY